MEPRYSNIEVQLSGEDGNGFFIVGRVAKALRKSGVSADVVSEFRTEALSGDYDHLLQTVMRWVETT